VYFPSCNAERGQRLISKLNNNYPLFRLCEARNDQDYALIAALGPEARGI
jgi:hypothetical protein